MNPPFQPSIVVLWTCEVCHVRPVHCHIYLPTVKEFAFNIDLWWFQSFCIFHNIWDNPCHWLIVFKMVKNHQPVYLPVYLPYIAIILHWIDLECHNVPHLNSVCVCLSFGWYFHVFPYIYIYWFVAWNMFHVPCIGNNHPNWLTFFRWVETTNQYIYIIIDIHIQCPIDLPYTFICVSFRATRQLRGFVVEDDAARPDWARRWSPLLHANDLDGHPSENQLSVFLSLDGKHLKTHLKSTLCF